MKWFRMIPKRWAAVVGGFVLLLAVLVFGAAWYYSIQIEDGVLRVKHDPTKYDVEIIALESDRVGLRFPTEKDLLKQPETVGIDWPGGYASLGDTIDIHGVGALREYELLEGTMTVGMRVHLDKFSFPGDPARAPRSYFQRHSVRRATWGVGCLAVGRRRRHMGDLRPREGREPR